MAAARHSADPAEPTPAPARHADADPLVRARIDRLLTQQQIVMIWFNAVAALAMFLNAPGASPAMRFLAVTGLPLPGWGVLWSVVVLLLALGVAGYATQQYAHVLAFVLWGLTGAGAIVGLVSGTTTSPSASVVLAGLITAMAAWHVVALLFRRRIARG